MAPNSAMLLGLLLCVSLHAASASRALLQSSPNTTLTGLVGGTSALSTLLSAVSTAGLADALGGNGTFTVFAPSNDAFTKDIKSIYCIKDYGFGGKCANASDLLAAQNLKTILLNHVVAGSFPASSLANGTLLKTLGGAVQRVVILPNGTVTVGGAPVVTADVAATNGLAHVMGGVLYRDSQFNTTTIGTYLDTIADLGPQVTSPQSFPEAKKALMVQDALDNVDRFRSYRPIVEKPDGGYTYPMPLLFDNTQGNRESYCVPTEQPKWTYPEMTNVTRPADNETLAYMSVMELAALIKSKQVTSKELVDLYTARLKQYDYILEAVVTYTTDLALQQAALADQLLANGTYLGPLHGIPYGLKDLIAVPPYRTTWGSGAFINQVIPREATVYSKLKAAGAVLVAKLATGEMATGDEWWGGKTKCPWNIAVGASGSSAGPGAGVAAGLVGFALGTETGGSIIGPAAQNGISGFRPTFGLTSRAYCMALSQTLDKVGPLARTAQDAAVILDVIRGKDGIDTSACNVALQSPFTIDVTNLTVGYLPDTPAAALTIFNETLKMKLVPVSFKNSAPDFSALYEVIRGAEAAAYFDYWMRSGNIENNTAPLQWPLRLRRSRMIPAVEYIQATRVRGVAITEMFAAFSGVDVFLGPSTTYTSYGNVVNIPEISIPYGFGPATVPSNYTASTPRKNPLNVGIYGLPYTDSKILAVAMAFQKVNTANKLRPPIDLIEPEVLSNCSYPLSRCNIPAATVALLSQTGINNPPVQIKTYGSV